MPKGPSTHRRVRASPADERVATSKSRRTAVPTPTSNGVAPELAVLTVVRRCCATKQGQAVVRTSIGWGQGAFRRGLKGPSNDQLIAGHILIEAIRSMGSLILSYIEESRGHHYEPISNICKARLTKVDASTSEEDRNIGRCRFDRQPWDSLACFIGGRRVQRRHLPVDRYSQRLGVLLASVSAHRR